MPRSLVDTVVVGFDASPAGRAAVGWAADEARRRRLRLHIIHAWEPPPILSIPLFSPVGTDSEVVLQEAMAIAGEIAPDVPVRRQALPGPAALALVDASTEADTVVVGAHGHRRSLMGEFGSTAWQVCMHAACPVVVVRELPTEEAPHDIVVGVDGSRVSDNAVEYAFAQASRRAAPLVAVHGLHMDALATYYTELQTEEARVRVEERADADLAQWLTPWGKKYPDVQVRRLVVRRHPVDALLGEAQHAQLVVVGSRGRGGFRGLVLGSVGIDVLRDADCPVAVVRPYSG